MHRFPGAPRSEVNGNYENGRSSAGASVQCLDQAHRADCQTEDRLHEPRVSPRAR